VPGGASPPGIKKRTRCNDFSAAACRGSGGQRYRAAVSRFGPRSSGFLIKIAAILRAHHWLRLSCPALCAGLFSTALGEAASKTC